MGRIKGQKIGEFLGSNFLCEVCSKSFYRKPYEIKHGYTRFCSQNCHYVWKRGSQPSQKSLSYYKQLRIGTYRKCKNCFSKFYVKPSRKKSAEFCSPRCKGLVARIRYVGKNSPGWKGGTTQINALLRTSARYKEWRTAIFIRDNRTCQICGYIGNNIQADHIKPFAYFPELRFELSNGRTLCIPCHKKTETYGKGAIKIYG